MKRMLTILFLVVISMGISRAQSLIRDTVRNVALINFSYSYQIPQGDFADRFGPATNLGAGPLFKVGQNWLIGLEGSFMFSRNVREDNIADQIVNPDGTLIGQNGFLEEYFFNLSGYMIRANGGKLFSLDWLNPNSGIFVTGGVGFWQHKIAMDVDSEQAPQFSEEKIKGVDRLTNGIVFSEMVGFMFLDPNKLFNFFFGIEFHQGITENRRDWNFNLNRNLEGQRLDAVTNLKIGFMIPIYMQKTQEYYYH